MPAPDHMLEVGSGSHAQQTARVMERLEPVLDEERPDLVIVPGDVNSTLAAALTAAKMQIPVAHIESGLRSFDRTMPEEINRIVADEFSEHLFLHSDEAIDNLRAEGIAERADPLRRQHDDRHAGRAGGALPGRRGRGEARCRARRLRRSSPCTAPPSSTAPLLPETVARLAALAARDAGRLPGPPAHPQDDGGDRVRAPGPAALRAARLPRLPLAARRRRRRPHRLRRHPGGDDLPRHPLLHPARQHRAPGHDHAPAPTPCSGLDPAAIASIPAALAERPASTGQSLRRSGTARPPSGSPTSSGADPRAERLYFSRRTPRLSYPRLSKS